MTSITKGKKKIDLKFFYKLIPKSFERIHKNSLKKKI